MGPVDPAPTTMASPTRTPDPAPAAAAWAAPGLRHAGRLHFAFDEDELTLADDAVRHAGLPPGSALATELELPAWWWSGRGLRRDEGAPWQLRRIPTAVGPVLVVHAGTARFDAARLGAQAFAAAQPVEQATLAAVQAARDGPDTEADYPLGAFVPAARHEQVTAARLGFGAARVLSWTTIGAGAAPTEFARLQAAQGAYQVVLVQAAGEAAPGRVAEAAAQWAAQSAARAATETAGSSAMSSGGAPARTVGIWTGHEAPAPGTACVPALRRLYRMQGAWRHGVKFAPAAPPGSGSPP